MTAATMPTGISSGASSVREMMSARSMSTTPTSTVAGTSARKFGPTRRRAMCGHTSPTKVRPPPTAQASPDTLLFIVTTGIGTYFISAAFPKINAFILAQLPSGFRQRLEGLGADLRGSFGGFMRAQLILMAMTFIELLIAFLLLGVRGALGIAAVTALIDALPVFGTGVVLVPWAVFCLLLGSTGRAIGLIVCWALVNLVRSCTQAKLLGDQIGLDPIAPQVIRQFLNSGLVYEDAEHHNCVFVGKNSAGQVK